METARRYTSLRTISRVFRVFGWIIAVVGTLGAVATAIAVLNDPKVENGSLAAFLALIGVLIGTALYALIFFAVAEGIVLMIDIEANTRQTAEAISDGMRPAPAPEPAPPPESAPPPA